MTAAGVVVELIPKSISSFGAERLAHEPLLGISTAGIKAHGRRDDGRRKIRLQPPQLAGTDAASVRKSFRAALAWACAS
jgi:hypothetical protein